MTGGMKYSGKTKVDSVSDSAMNGRKSRTLWRSPSATKTPLLPAIKHARSGTGLNGEKPWLSFRTDSATSVETTS